MFRRPTQVGTEPLTHAILCRVLGQRRRQLALRRGVAIRKGAAPGRSDRRGRCARRHCSPHVLTAREQHLLTIRTPRTTSSEIAVGRTAFLTRCNRLVGQRTSIPGASPSAFTLRETRLGYSTSSIKRSNSIKRSQSAYHFLLRSPPFAARFREQPERFARHPPALPAQSTSDRLPGPGRKAEAHGP